MLPTAHLPRPFSSLHTTTTTTTLTTLPSRTTWIYHPSLFINNTHLPKAVVVIPFLASVQAGFYPHGPLGSWWQQKSPKNSSARTATVDKARWQSPPLVRLASVKRPLYFVSSLIGNFEHPVGRHGEGWEKGNTARRKRSENRAPVWGCGHFSWGPLYHAGFTPLGKEPHPPSRKVVSALKWSWNDGNPHVRTRTRWPGRLGLRVRFWASCTPRVACEDYRYM